MQGVEAYHSTPHQLGGPCAKRIKVAGRGGLLIEPQIHSGRPQDDRALPVLQAQRRGADAGIFLAETGFQQEVFARRITADVEGRRLDLITPEHLILFKLIASHPRDLSDVQDVLFTQGQLDEASMRRWAEPLGVAAKLEDVRSSWL